MKYLCASCDQLHEGLPELSVAEPSFIEELPAEKRQFVTEMGPSVRAYREGDAVHGFVRGRLELPVVGSDEPLRYAVWAGLSRESMIDLAEGNEGPWVGLFQSVLPGWPNTLNLKVDVRVPRELGRAMFTLEPTDHALSVAQREGMSQQQAIDLVTPVVSMKKG